jgi:hypothetical protein
LAQRNLVIGDPVFFGCFFLAYRVEFVSRFALKNCLWVGGLLGIGSYFFTLTL